ncbi:MAG: hypothetical protein ACFB50_14135 [Rubrobacteraceae bacterium]
MNVAGWVLSIIGLVCGLVGLLSEGIPIEWVGILFGVFGYYFGIRSGDRLVQIVGACAAILSLIALFVVGIELPPQ